jgi:hypothetical protein
MPMKVREVIRMIERDGWNWSGRAGAIVSTSIPSKRAVLRSLGTLATICTPLF